MSNGNAFALGLKFVFKWEGGYVNDPNDPGGETKYGISKRANPSVDIFNLTKEQAGQIYLRDYWHKVGCDNYEANLAICIFDAAVNVGVSRVRGWLTDDFNKPSGLNADEFNSRREYYYTVQVKESLRIRYLKGWMNRLNDLRRFIKT